MLLSVLNLPPSCPYVSCVHVAGDAPLTKTIDLREVSREGGIGVYWTISFTYFYFLTRAVRVLCSLML